MASGIACGRVRTTVTGIVQDGCNTLGWERHAPLVYTFFDFGHPCHGQFTPVNTRYLLTSIMWLYYRLKFRAYQGHLFLKLTADQVQVFFGLWAHVRLTCCNHWQVVWKPVYSNPVLKKLTEVYVFLAYKYFFCVFCGPRDCSNSKQKAKQHKQKTSN